VREAGEAPIAHADCCRPPPWPTRPDHFPTLCIGAVSEKHAERMPHAGGFRLERWRVLTS